MSVSEQRIILVDDNDREVGSMEKMEVHRQGLLHRAFSVFIFDTQGRLLLQKRADGKYHSGGLWTNTCCSHPLYGEGIYSAVQRRMVEEMGFTCPVTKAFELKYRCSFANGLVEYEYDHVFIGQSDEVPRPDLREVQAWQYITLPELNHRLQQNPQDFSYWFKLLIDGVATHFDSHLKARTRA